MKIGQILCLPNNCETPTLHSTKEVHQKAVKRFHQKCWHVHETSRPGIGNSSSKYFFRFKRKFLYLFFFFEFSFFFLCVFILFLLGFFLVLVFPFSSRQCQWQQADLWRKNNFNFTLGSPNNSQQIMGTRPLNFLMFLPNLVTYPTYFTTIFGRHVW